MGQFRIGLRDTYHSVPGKRRVCGWSAAPGRSQGPWRRDRAGYGVSLRRAIGSLIRGGAIAFMTLDCTPKAGDYLFVGTV
jgi:hypothetical protein